MRAPLLRAALAPGVVADLRHLARASAVKVAPRERKHAERARGTSSSRSDDEHDRRGAQRQRHRAQRAVRGAPPAARGKKITRSASRGTSLKLFTSSAWRRPSRVSLGNRRPHPRVELTAKGLDQLLLLLRRLHVALGEQYLTVTGLHTQELHRLRIMANRPGGAARLSGLCRRECSPTALAVAGASRSQASSPTTSTGPAPAPSHAAPLATASPAIARAVARRLERCRGRAQAARPAPRSACSPEP